MVVFRDSQENIEVLKTGGRPDFRDFQENIEVLKTGYIPVFRESQESVEVLKAFNAPQVVCTIPLESGTYISLLTIKILADIHGATIHYTLDGSTPDDTSLMYTGEIAMFTGKLSAYATADGYVDSDVVTADYVAQVPRPEITPRGGVYSDPVSVEISSVISGATIFYTTDGTTPDETSTVYTGAITDFTGVVIAYAIATGYVDSAVSIAIYSVGASWPDNLPAPQKAISVQATSNLEVQRLQSGRQQIRRFGANSPDKIKVQLRLPADKIQFFENWYNTMINFGASWFSANWLIKLGYPNHRARILGYPDLKGNGTKYADYGIVLLVQLDSLIREDIVNWWGE